MPTVRFADSTPPQEVPHGTPLTEVLFKIGYKEILWGCSEGVCGACRFLPVEGGEALKAPGGIEAVLLKNVSSGPGERIACHVRVTSDLTVAPAPSVFKKR